MTKGRQTQIKKAIQNLTFGCLTHQLNLQPLDSLEKQSLSLFIRRMWLHFQHHPTHLHLISGNWPIISIHFGNRNGAILYSEFYKIHQQFLDSLSIHNDDFKNTLLILTDINCHQNFEERCKILCISSQDILSRVDAETNFQPTIPFLGQPIFEDQYLSEPGTLFNDLLSVFSIQEYRKFDDRLSVVEQPASLELSVCEPLTEQPSRKRKLNRMDIEKTSKKKHRRPSYKKLKKKMLKLNHDKVKKVRPKTIRQQKAETEVRRQQQPRKNKQLKNAKKRRIYIEDMEDPDFVDDTITMNSAANNNILNNKVERRFQVYTVHKLHIHQAQSTVGCSDKAAKFLERLKYEIKCQRQERVYRLMLEVAYQYMSDTSIRPDCMIHLQATYLIYLASIKFEAHLKQQATILFIRIVQYEFIKLVAAITNEFSGGSNQQLEICFQIHKGIRRILIQSPQLSQLIPNLEYVFAEMTNQQNQAPQFFEQPLFKQVYVANIYSETYKKMTPINKEFVASVRVADVIINENKIYADRSGNHRRVLQLLKQLYDGVQQKQEVMRMFNEIHSLYGIKFAFEEFQAMVSFVQPLIEGKVALTSVEVDFIQSLFKGYLSVQLDKSKNYKNLLNKMLKQTFLSRAKTRDCRNLQRLYLLVASLLLEYDVFRNQFVYKQLVSGVDPKIYLECASQFQHLLLKIIKLNFRNNKSAILTQFDQNKVLGLTSVCQQCLKLLLTWMCLLLDILDDNIRHLKILKHRELQETVSARLNLLEGIFSQLMPQQMIPLQQYIFVHRMVSEVGCILNRQEEQFQPLKTSLLRCVTFHWTRRVSEIDVEQECSSTLLTESEEQEVELLRLHKNIKRQDALMQQLRQFTKNTYKNSTLVNQEIGKSQLQFQFSGCLYYMRHLIKRQTFEDMTRSLSMQLERPLSKTLDRRYNYRCVTQSYNFLFRMLKNTNMKMSASDGCYRQFLQVVIISWVLNGSMLEDYALDTPLIPMPIYFTEQQWEKQSYETIKQVCRVLPTVEDTVNTYCNMLQIFVYLLQSQSNKSIEILNQLFRVHDKSAKLFFLTDGKSQNYQLVLEYLHQLFKYPSNIYKIKSNLTIYVGTQAQQFVRYIENQHLTMEQILNSQWPTQTQFDVFICQLTVYLARVHDSNHLTAEIVKIIESHFASEDALVRFCLFLVVSRIRRQLGLPQQDSIHIVRQLPLDYQEQAMKLIF